MDATEKLLEKLVGSISRCGKRMEDFSDNSAREALRFQKAFARDLETLKATIEKVNYEICEGNKLGPYEPAFENATKKIKSIVREDPNSCLDIKILAVSASFSWIWITENLIPLLSEPSNDQTSCNIEMLLVDPDYELFQKAGCNSDKIPWHEMSGRRVAEAHDLIADHPDLRQRLMFSISYYRNLPHWHGVLIQDWSLLLGRTTWKGTPPDLDMRVGENEYREYSRSGQAGVDRIDVFKNWFSFYSSIGRQVFSHKPSAS